GHSPLKAGARVRLAVRAANRKTSLKSISQQIRNTKLEESTLTKSAHAAFKADLGQKTLIFSPARPVQDDAQQNAQEDCRKALAPSGPGVLRGSRAATILFRLRRQWKCPAGARGAKRHPPICNEGSRALDKSSPGFSSLTQQGRILPG